MESNYFISIVLDKRRKKADGKYPVKLRVFTKVPRKQKLYGTKFNFTEKEFDSIWKTDKPRTDVKKMRAKLFETEKNADEIAEKINPFSFETFEKRLFRKKSDVSTLAYHYKAAIDEYLSREQIGTANNYRDSLRSFEMYLEHLERNIESLTFYDITENWLKDYEYYMLEVKGRSVSTLGFYLRPLRALFNKAIEEEDIEAAYYPFGKRKYQIPKKRAVKKALTLSQLKTLYESVPENEIQEKTKDFWFFSYLCYGMNMKDIVSLKWKNVKYDSLSFYRAKTKLTSKKDLKEIVVPITDPIRVIIEKHGVKSENGDDYVFPILESHLSSIEKQKRLKDFTRFVNQHLKKIAKANELPPEISTYWARHTFATNSIRKGVSMEFIQESLGHSDLNTTKDYFAGFENASKRKVSEGLLDF